MIRRRGGTDTDGPAADSFTDQADTGSAAVRSRLARRAAGAQSREEAEERYVAARNAWTLAMRAASTGRPADLAALAIAQDAYEAAHAERERWLSGVTVAIPVEPAHDRELEAAIRHELAWRGVLDRPQPKGGVLSRIRRRIRGD